MQYRAPRSRANVLWLALAIALACGWWFDRTRLAEQLDRLQSVRNSERVRRLNTEMQRDAWKRAAGIDRGR